MRSGANASARCGRLCLLAFAAVFLLTSAPGRAQGWSVVRSPSGSGQAASTISADGHRLYIWAKHLDDRSLVFAELHLENGDEFAGRMPIYRIDGGEPVDTERVRREGEKQGSLWGFVAGRACFWLIWASNHPVVDANDHLAQWMTGKTLAITYEAADGVEKNVDFDLDGARGAIQKAASVTLP